MKKILVVIDMQNDFTTGCLGNAECAAAIPAVCDVIREGSYDEIILTRDTHQENYMDTQEGRRLPVKHCIEGTDGWEICDEVMAAAKSAVGESGLRLIDKPSFGSLYLAQVLEELCDSEDELDFVGVCTGICVISNVLIAKAALPENTIRVIERACACVTEDSHKTAIAAMECCQVDIIRGE